MSDEAEIVITRTGRDWPGPWHVAQEGKLSYHCRDIEELLVLVKVVATQMETDAHEVSP